MSGKVGKLPKVKSKTLKSNCSFKIEFSEDEREFIMQRTSKKTYDKIYELFLNRGDFASLKIILHYKSIYYSAKEEQDRLYNLLKEAFEVDGDFSRVEKVFVSFFKRMSSF